MDKFESQSEHGEHAANESELKYATPPGEIVLGTLMGIDEQGQPVVSFQLNSLHQNVTAIATTPISTQQIGRQVGLLFAQNPEHTPVLVGVIHNALHSILDNITVVDANEDETLFSTNEVPKKAPSLDGNDAFIDGQRVVIEGRDEVVLKCGESSITLNKNGKISIRGKYLLNRSSGVNRIMGGSVQVN